MLDAHAHGGVAAPAVYLCPAGHARAHFVAKHVVRKLVAELLHELRALGTRADDAHVADQHIEQLRQLVERPRANPAADLRAPGIVFLSPLCAGLALRADAHRAELDDVERLAIESHPHLAIEDRPAVLEPDRRSNQDHHRRPHQQQRRADGEIEAALNEPAPAFQRRLRQIDRRQTIDVLDARAQHHELQKIGHDVNRNDAAR